jgi:hypothetical protein
VAPLKQEAEGYLEEAVKLALDLNKSCRPATKEKIVALLRKYHAIESIVSKPYDFLAACEKARQNQANNPKRPQA